MENPEYRCPNPVIGKEYNLETFGKTPCIMAPENAILCTYIYAEQPITETQAKGIKESTHVVFDKIFV